MKKSDLLRRTTSKLAVDHEYCLQYAQVGHCIGRKRAESEGKLRPGPGASVHTIRWSTMPSKEPRRWAFFFLFFYFFLCVEQLCHRLPTKLLHRSQYLPKLMEIRFLGFAPM